jgi:GAF domain-containing protein
MDPNHDSKEAAFVRFNDTLVRDGLRPALAYLLSLSDFRFIAIFRSQGDRSRPAVFYDREQPETLSVDEVPSSATYCSLAIKSKSVFETSNAPQDPRLTSHAAREAVQSYWGLPVMTPEGEILGTLCQYDVVPRDTQHVDLQLMVEVASLLQQRGLVPPYPMSPSAPSGIT